MRKVIIFLILLLLVGCHGPQRKTPTRFFFVPPDTKYENPNIIAYLHWAVEQDRIKRGVK